MILLCLCGKVFLFHEKGATLNAKSLVLKSASFIPINIPTFQLYFVRLF